MARRRRQKRLQVPSAMTQLGLAWYGREDWERLREIAWCRERRRRIDMATRSEYVSYLLSQEKKDSEAPS